MATHLEIKYDGSVDGLSEHRLSVSAFGPALNALVKALRRIATNIVGNALGPQDLATERLKSTAKPIDIEISAIKEGIAEIVGVVTITPPPGAQIPLLSDLPDRVMSEFMESLEAEAAGVLRNSGVRSYLSSIPQGVTEHVYTYRNTNTVRTVILGTLALASPLHLAILKEITGSIIGVGFEPGKSEIRIKSVDGKVQALPATSEQVNSAIAMRGAMVRAVAVVGYRTRVVTLQPADAPRYSPSQHDRDKYLFEKWKNVLQELAK